MGVSGPKFIAAALTSLGAAHAVAQNAGSPVPVRNFGTIELRASIEPTASGAGETVPASLDCGRAAARYEVGLGTGLWILRTGSMRPLEPGQAGGNGDLIVFEVWVDGKLATAFGRSYDALRQGGHPAELERAQSAAILWDASVEPRAATFSTVGEDGAPFLGPFLFQQCGLTSAGTAARQVVQAAPKPRGARWSILRRRHARPFAKGAPRPQRLGRFARR